MELQLAERRLFIAAEDIADLLCAGADNAAQAKDLALMQLEVDVLEQAVVAEVFRLEQDVVLGNGLLVEVVIFAGAALADHHLVELGLGGVFGVDGADAGAVFVDVDAVGDLEDLIKTVRDEDDRMALRSDFAHLLEEVLHLALVENGGRFVEQDETMVLAGLLGHVHDLRDLDHLAGGEVEVADLFLRVDVGDVDVGKDLGRGLVHLVPVDEAGLTERIFRAEEDVLRDVEVDDQGLFLIDHADAVVLGVHRGLRGIGFAAERHRAGGLRLRADDDLQQGGFARAVFADEADDLTRVDIQLDALEGLGAGEVFGDLLCTENDFFVAHDLSLLTC